MNKSKPEKMKEKEEKMKEKKAKLERKLKGAAKAVATATALLALALVTGCQDTVPSARSNQAGYGDFEPSVVINGSSNTVNLAVTVGDGIYATADGGGDSQATTPTQTTDVKPEVAVGVGGGSAGTGGGSQETGPTAAVLNALKGLGNLITPQNEKAVTEAVKSACKDGNCAPK